MSVLSPRRPRQQRDPQGRMSLVEHVRELRNRAGKAALAVAVAAAVAFALFAPVWGFLKQPFCDIEQAQALRGSCTLVVTGIFDAFFLRLKLSLIVGTVAAAPVWLYQLWAFVTPGLRRHERRWALTFLGSAVPLFFGGAVLAYVTVSKGLGLLIGFAPDDVIPLITVNNYLSYLVTMLLVFGVSFELPLVVVLLNFAGLLSHRRLVAWRRGAIFAVFVFAAVATPSQDPFTMLALALPMCLFYEVAVLVARIHDRRVAARDPLAAMYAGLGDDEASPLDARPSRLDELP